MKYCRTMSTESLKKAAASKKYDGVVLGHENCPVYYRQSNISEMIDYALNNGLKVKVNIPVLFEDYLEEFKEVADKIVEKYNTKVKIIVNDWGILYYLHNKYPDLTFCAGKGISFSYGDNPWNEHILLAEKEKYQEALKSSNMENEDTICALKELGVDEIEMADLKLSENAYKHLANEGFTITVNKWMSIATMSRACHCLRFLNKVEKMGNCIQYCTKPIVVSIKQYFDMAETKNKPVSPETKKIQPDMYIDGNITMVINDKKADDLSFVNNIIYDERIMKYGNLWDEIV